MQNKIQTPTWVAAAALGLALLVGGVTGTKAHTRPEKPGYRVGSDSHSQTVFERGFSPVVRSAAPAVVNISSSKVVRSPEASPGGPGGPGGPMDESFMRRFFGEDFARQFRVPRERRERSLGSGVIVNASGYILTNSHVVEGSSDVKVSLSDNRELTGQIIGTDPGTDIAVL